MSEGQRQIQRYGWRPSLPDHRDLLADTTGLAPLPEVDPRGEMPAVFDQGQLGSCTANAVGAALEYDGMLDGAAPVTPSRLFIYYCEREIEGSLGKGDTGAFGRDGFKAAKRYGTPPETDWPYDTSKYADDPPQSAWDDAAAHKLTKSYKSVPRSVNQFKQVLSNKQTIALGFSVYESFESAGGGEDRHRADADARTSSRSAATRCSPSATSRASRTICSYATAGARTGGSAATS